jgi:Flp pilus assembly pilin Flp
MLIRFLNNEDGATAVEYAAIASFLSILIYAGALSIGRGLADQRLQALLKAWTSAQN